MIKVVILGAGNVAFHLCRAIENSEGIQLTQRFRRSEKRDSLFSRSVPVTDDVEALMEADIYILAINDDAIEQLSQQLTYLNGLVVHTSGSIPITNLNPVKRRGVLYPLQTFSLDHPLDFRKISLVIESENETDHRLLKTFSELLSERVFVLNSEQRKHLHLAAVFANNFTNYMYISAEEICREKDIEFEILKPLILETASKVLSLDPAAAQTGPAKRQDQGVLHKHLSYLNGEKKEIYSLLSDKISKRFKK